jgi:hypothetical protein
MKWTVIYRPAAADELAAIWLNAENRPAVASAADAIDKHLGIDPLSAGESRAEGSRVLIEDPLAVFFDVNVQDRTIAVWAVVYRQ